MLANLSQASFGLTEWTVGRLDVARRFWIGFMLGPANSGCISLSAECASLFHAWRVSFSTQATFHLSFVDACHQKPLTYILIPEYNEFSDFQPIFFGIS